mmetsp:Transcript_12066/g.33916  ORF Transcript_12066/g.33916 Transcript_12066/m.33916 type:complete len:279 (+) Transcript_12066:1584-2420(+)
MVATSSSSALSSISLPSYLIFTPWGSYSGGNMTPPCCRVVHLISLEGTWGAAFAFLGGAVPMGAFFTSFFTLTSCFTLSLTFFLTPPGPLSFSFTTCRTGLLAGVGFRGASEGMALKNESAGRGLRSGSFFTLKEGVDFGIFRAARGTLSSSLSESEGAWPLVEAGAARFCPTLAGSVVTNTAVAPDFLLNRAASGSSSLSDILPCGGKWSSCFPLGGPGPVGPLRPPPPFAQRRLGDGGIHGGLSSFLRASFGRDSGCRIKSITFFSRRVAVASMRQ